jgi:hypothetical protein
MSRSNGPEGGRGDPRRLLRYTEMAWPFAHEVLGGLAFYLMYMHHESPGLMAKALAVIGQMAVIVWTRRRP